MKEIMKKYRKAKGFTLVELLIVIIIIGILAGMMMLSTGSATDKAEATKIVSDMRNVKAACLMYYADNSKYPDATTPSASIDQYLDTTAKNMSLVSGDSTSLFVKYDTNTAKTPTGVITKLNDIRKSSGAINGKNSTTDSKDVVVADGVFMIIRK